MAKKKLGLVHTSAAVVPIFQQLCKDKLPGVDVFNIADDSLVQDLIANGCMTPSMARRVVDHVASAERTGADVVMVTCSSVGAATEMAATMSGVPVLRVDQPMADKAVSTGRRIGVIATLASTLEPTRELIRRRAQAAGREVDLTARLCEGAFDAFLSGDGARHDSIVAEALRELAESVDVIVLAQASMARVVDTMPESDRRVPILASPPIAIGHLAALLK
jgi:Asp/Glu/hydantoin racemase